MLYNFDIWPLRKCWSVLTDMNKYRGLGPGSFPLKLLEQPPPLVVVLNRPSECDEDGSSW